MKTKLKINGFKKIASGKMVSKVKIKLLDTTIFLVQYDLNDLHYFMFEGFISYIGYTSDIELASFIQLHASGFNYCDFLTFVGR
jgi:hypothetical protein